MKKFEDAGIKDYKWMFEVDRNGNKSGNFVTIINYAEYELDKKLILEELHKKYGEKPKGDNAKQFKLELKEWRKTHCINEFSDIPNPTMYHNDAFDRLKKDSVRYGLYKEYIELKKILDNKLGLDVNPFAVIQKRKDAFQRIADSSKSAGELWENIKQLERERWMDAEDDDQIFG